MSALKTGILMFAIFLLFLLVGGLLDGQEGMVIAFVIALASNGVMYWFSDKIVLAMYHAHPVTADQAPRLHEIVRTLAERANLPMPKVYVIDSPNPNAFATGRNPKHAAVAVTTGILKLLSEDQLSGVIGHELAHVEHRDILIATVAATIAATISLVATMARWSLIFGGGGRGRNRGNPFALIVIAIIAPLVALFIQLWISRTREYAADARGAQLAQNPLLLARALQRLEHGVELHPAEVSPATAHMFIVSPFSARTIGTWFSTHPPIEDRVARLEKMAEAQ
ncbi:MAG: zinc metalloprotease HtpX [Candidatus Brocadiia bacterium]